MVGKARKRGVGHRRAARVQEEEEEKEEQGPPPSPGDPSYFQDQVDAFHEARSQAALAPSWSDGESGAEDPEEEEVLGLDVPEEEEEEDDDEEDEDGEGEDAASVGGSSVLSEAEDPDPGLSWGRRKSLYYDTDYGAPRGRGQQSQQEADEAAREEEEEAQLIQRRLAQALHEDDAGLDWLQALGKEPQEPRPREPPSRVVADLAALPAKEKLKLLRKEAPELPELLHDLKAKLTELRDELEPLLRLVPPGPGSRYLRTKYSLYLAYCANVSFYLVLKARRAPVHGHPVIPRLVAYRTLINRLAPLERRLAGQARRLLTQGREAVPKKRPPQVRATAPPSEDSEPEEVAAPKPRGDEEERLKLKRKKEEAQEEEEGDPGTKRAITYQIAKNKGLTPRRKKIDRNPRVKHREKFRRAKIRRRGQVPQVRTEEYKYSGELSGIRAGVKKSIKLK
ncbi:something about silencing protein 10 [Trichosurus vulpecula]|uniref:something about silencing protein 10 n=1 Tax=Trichosurus vulpecula TaxID=9337 RepID=UPI00186B2D04|nr:something about silencing protein 10 [Trichosurus vulpecula]